jgi:hypothetical protein
MGSTTKKTASAPKKERVVLTPQQRIEKAEAELERLRQVADKKANKERDAAWEKRAKAVTRRDQAQAVIDEIDSQFPQPDETPADDTSSDTES